MHPMLLALVTLASSAAPPTNRPDPNLYSREIRCYAALLSCAEGTQFRLVEGGAENVGVTQYYQRQKGIFFFRHDGAFFVPVKGKGRVHLEIRLPRQNPFFLTYESGAPSDPLARDWVEPSSQPDSGVRYQRATVTPVGEPGPRPVLEYEILKRLRSLGPVLAGASEPLRKNIAQAVEACRDNADRQIVEELRAIDAKLKPESKS